MRILFIGDVFGDAGVGALADNLPGIRDEYDIDICVANAENAAARGVGLSKSAYRTLCENGVDAITLGNHTWKNRDVFQILGQDGNVVRPANFPAGSPGAGSAVLDADKACVGVICVLGRIYMDCVDCPFAALDREIDKVSRRTNIIIVDVHGEATSEKCALAYYVDGRVSCVAGTHTHVQTADERILGGGSAFITDVGMTGPMDGVIGVNRDTIIRRFKSQIPERYEPAQGRRQFSAVVVDVGDMTGKASSISRIWREYA
jgi:metallophosphoesterase (TIGR00282 family)